MRILRYLYKSGWCMKFRRKAFFATLFLLFIGIEAWATHIRAGEIVAVRISQNSLRYRFTLIIYSDTGSGVAVGEGGTFNFGDGREITGGREILIDEATFFDEELIGNETRRTIFEFEHTFTANNVFRISYTEQNRNDNILNINNGSSDQTAFHIETIIRIDPGLLGNGTPQLTIPPIDRACVGARFIHNPGAFDPDGDSLAYKIVVPQQRRGEDVDGYVDLNDAAISNMREDGGSPALFQIDPITGDFVWDAPQEAGEYNAAFIVEEWRFSELTGRYELLGFVTRDMQILVEDCDNERPELEIPADTCVEAGSTLLAQIMGSDPDGNLVLVEAFGGVFSLSSNPATFTQDDNGTQVPPQFARSPVTSTFRWETDLSHVRTRPYEVQFKISDAPSDPLAPSLVDFKTWNVTVVAPAPTGLTSSVASGQSIQLNWDDYIGADFAPTMQVWRRVDSYDFTPEHCVTGIPANSGYELIAELPINQTSYEDTDAVRPGVNYCYRLVAVFPTPGGGISYASDESCQTIPLDVPAITNVSVEETSTTNGEVFVRWTSPLEIDESLFPPPFRYELLRYEGLNGQGASTLVASTTDTVFTDTGLNTEENPYHYSVRFYDASDNLLDSSATASTVRLEATGLVLAAEINWTADVPWSNVVQATPYHYIYRNRTDANGDDEANFFLIDSVDVTADGLRYIDQGQFNGVSLRDDREYCYFVTTQGSYGNDLIPSPLLNNSQISCVEPSDNIPPNEPEIEIPGDTTVVIVDGQPLIILENPNCPLVVNEPCGFNDYSNTFTWTVDNVDGDIASFNVYYSTSGASDSFTLIGNTRDNIFTHEGLSSFKGCYRIAAVDRSNNESTLSAPVCFDNCPNYVLPNTFTPNGDGINDTFRAFDQPNDQCPRFVQAVEVNIFSRWGGASIWTYNSSEEAEPNFFIDWDGRDEDGNEVPEGTYYYSVRVTFDVFDANLREQEFRNWVKVIR